MKPRNLNRYFNASFQERVSVITLIGLLLCTMVIYVYIHWNPPVPDFIIEQLNIPEEQVDSISKNNKNAASGSGYRLTPFNPNKVTAGELTNLGIPVKTASAWIHYLMKGGKFKQPGDIKKIFGMNEVLFNKIVSYIQLEDPSKKLAEDSPIPGIKSKMIIDPNSANYAELTQAGFPGKTANTLIHYRSSGKTFTSMNDLIKIYGMNDSILNEVSPYVRFPISAESSKLEKPASVTTVAEPDRFDLNKADTTLLKSLPGIGHVLAVRIILYREKLGGYSSLDQLREVYGLKDSVISGFRSRLTITEPYKKIKINQDSFSMVYHPYLSKKDAAIIQNYRIQHGEFKSIKDLDNLKAFDHRYWEKILPYLDFSVR